MIAEALIAAALAPAYHGRTAEDRPLRINVSGRRVTRVKGSVLAYECAEFGDVGPVAFDRRVDIPIRRRDGRFSLVVGDRAERIGVAGVIRGDHLTGRVRMSGTIATGQRCASPIVRFRLMR